MRTRPCKSCGRPILWVRLASSRKPFPLDPDPSDRGNVEVRRGRVNPGTLYARVLVAADAMRAQQDGVILYLSHFATCQHASQHRKGRA